MTKLILGVISNCVKPIAEFQKIDQIFSTMKRYTARQSQENTFSSWESGSKQVFTSGGKTWRGLELIYGPIELLTSEYVPIRVFPWCVYLFEEQTAMFLMFYDTYIKTETSDNARVQGWAGLLHCYLSLIFISYSSVCTVCCRNFLSQPLLSPLKTTVPFHQQGRWPYEWGMYVLEFSSNKEVSLVYRYFSDVFWSDAPADCSLALVT